MLRISKLTDYGLVLLAHFAEAAQAAEAARENAEAVQAAEAARGNAGAAGLETATRNAREMSEATLLPYPAVSKILKNLAQEELLVSQRGAKGGYALSRPPREIRVHDIIEALEGPIALMACSAGPGHCDQESTCRIRDPWLRINEAVRKALAEITLADLVAPGAPPLAALHLVSEPAAN